MYNKLFGKILDSSIWLEPAPTRITWITLLAAMDEDGYAHFSAVENLAARARVTVPEAKKAVECFLAPDSNSGNPENEGRRIERVPGGFLIRNAKTHRATINRAIQLEQNRIRVARHRAKVKGEIPPSEQKTEAIATHANNGAIPTLAEVQEYGSMHGIKPDVSESLFNYHQGNTLWLNKHGRLVDWKHKLTTWEAGSRMTVRLPSDAKADANRKEADDHWAAVERDQKRRESK